MIDPSALYLYTQSHFSFTRTPFSLMRVPGAAAAEAAPCEHARVVSVRLLRDTTVSHLAPLNGAGRWWFDITPARCLLAIGRVSNKPHVL